MCRCSIVVSILACRAGDPGYAIDLQQRCHAIFFVILEANVNWLLTVTDQFLYEQCMMRKVYWGVQVTSSF